MVLFLQLICRSVFTNQALQLSLDGVLAKVSSLQVCMCYAIPAYVASVLWLCWSSGCCCCPLKKRGMAAPIPLQHPGTNTDAGAGMGADVSAAV